MVIAMLLLAGLSVFLYQRDQHYDIAALLAGLAILAAVTFFSFFTISKGIQSNNPHALIRAKYTGTMIKFFTCIAALLIYIFVNERHVHKPSLFLFMGMYIVFAALEAIPLSRLAKRN